MAPIFGAILFANAHYPPGIPTGLGAIAIAIRCAQHVDHDVSIKASTAFGQPPPNHRHASISTLQIGI
jgi:hypothetical protein